MVRDPNNICVVITGANRPDSLKCNLELYKYSYNYYNYYTIVSYTCTENDDDAWVPYIEDKTIYLGYMGIQSGCAAHLNTAIKEAKKTNCRYLFYINSDVFFLREKLIIDTINLMTSKGKFIGGNCAGYPTGKPYNSKSINTQWIFFDLEWSGLDAIFPLQQGPEPMNKAGDMWWHCLEQTFAWKYTCYLADEENIPYTLPTEHGWKNRRWPLAEHLFRKYFHFIPDLEPGPNCHKPHNKYGGRWQNILNSVTFSHYPDITRDGLKLFGFPTDERQTMIKKLVNASEEDFHPWEPPYHTWQEAWFDKHARWDYDGHELFTEEYLKENKDKWEQTKIDTKNKFSL